MKYLLAIMLVLVATTSANAGTCGPRDKIVKSLRAGYGEKPKYVAIIDRNILEVFVSPKGTWSILQTTGKGYTCVMGVGEAWGAHPATIGEEL
jgi:hypothetical protein